eukprot:500509-Hanusia_phi.AAC.4
MADHTESLTLRLSAPGAAPAAAGRRSAGGAPGRQPFNSRSEGARAESPSHTVTVTVLTRRQPGAPPPRRRHGSANPTVGDSVLLSLLRQRLVHGKGPRPERSGGAQPGPGTRGTGPGRAAVAGELGNVAGEQQQMRKAEGGGGGVSCPRDMQACRRRMA